MEALEHIIEKLNPRQKEAVNQIDGPVLVVAGPGTGKTQILSARIANILHLTDAKPQNILCLTFTEAGVKAMRERLIKMMGKEAYEVKVSTFHALGADIIREHHDFFKGYSLTPVSELEREQIIREILDDLPSTSVLKSKKDYYYHTSDMKTVFSLMKSEGIDQKTLLKDIDTYIKDMPYLEMYQYARKSGPNQKGDPKWNDIKKVTDKFDRLKETIHCFDQYLQKMDASRRFDFDDMLLWVHEAFAVYPELLLQYQELFQYVLIDEFQDTNGIQMQLLYQLISYWDNPHIFAVGDDDQSIYKFQGANLNNILDFALRFNTQIRTVLLEQNYRSSQAILDASFSLISLNTERIENRIDLHGITKKLKASNPEVSDWGIPPQLTAYANETQEAVATAQQIADMVHGGATPDRIAILYRNHKQSELIAKALLASNIPIYMVKSTDILKEPLIRNVIQHLEYLLLESESPFSGQHLLFDMLHMPQVGLKPIEIARLSHHIAYESRFFHTQEGRTGRFWREALDQITEGVADFGLSPMACQKIQVFHTQLEKTVSDMRYVTVSELVQKVINQHGFLAYAMSSEDKNKHIEALKTFFDFVELEKERNPGFSLKDVMNTLKTMEKLGLGMDTSRIYGSNKGVRLLSVHGSKGLEFEHVFMIGCTHKIWKEKNRSLPYGLGLIFSKDNDDVSTAEEARRLFFVGMTRAEKTLHISWSEDQTNASVFVTELLESGTCEKTTIAVSPEDVAQFVTKTLDNGSLFQHADMDYSWLDRFLENYSMSVTHLNNFLQCPLKFYYENVVRVPSAKNQYAGFGTAIHDTLDSWIKAYNQSQKTDLWDENMLLATFEKQMQRQKTHFTGQQFHHFLSLGKECLERYFPLKKEAIIHTEQILTEQRFKTEWDGIVINGAIDKIEIQQHLANLIDYKTGDPAKNKAKLQPPQPDAKETDSYEKRFGGDYWRQIVFYKILADQSPGFKWKTVSGEIDFIEREEGDTQQYKIVVSPSDEAVVKRQIKWANEAIQQKAFLNGCDKDDCYWCSFEKKWVR